MCSTSHLLGTRLPSPSQQRSAVSAECRVPTLLSNGPMVVHAVCEMTSCLAALKAGDAASNTLFFNMSDFCNILNCDDYQQQQYSLMKHALIGARVAHHDEIQNVSSGYGSSDDYVPSWNPRHPPTSHYNCPHSLNDNPASLVDPLSHPTFTSKSRQLRVRLPPLSPSPDLPTISEILKSHSATPRAKHNHRVSSVSNTHQTSSFNVPITAKPKSKGP